MIALRAGSAGQRPVVEGVEDAVHLEVGEGVVADPGETTDDAHTLLPECGDVEAPLGSDDDASSRGHLARPRPVKPVDYRPKKARSEAQSVQGTGSSNGSGKGATGTTKFPFRDSASPACPKCAWTWWALIGSG